MKLGPLDRLMGQLAKNITEEQLQEMEGKSQHVRNSDRGTLSTIRFLVSVKKQHSEHSEFLTTLLDLLQDVKDAEELKKTVKNFINKNPNIDSTASPAITSLHKPTPQMTKAFSDTLLKMDHEIPQKDLEIIRCISPLSERDKESARTGQMLFNALKYTGRIGPYDTELLHDIFLLLELVRPRKILIEYEDRYLSPAAAAAASLPPQYPSYPVVPSSHLSFTPPPRNPSYPMSPPNPPPPPPQSQSGITEGQAVTESVNSFSFNQILNETPPSWNYSYPLNSERQQVNAVEVSVNSNLPSRPLSYRDETYPRPPIHSHYHLPHGAGVPSVSTGTGEGVAEERGSSEQLSNDSHELSNQPQTFHRQVSSSHHSQSNFPPLSHASHGGQSFSRVPSLSAAVGQPVSDLPIPSAPPPPPLPPHPPQPSQDPAQSQAHHNTSSSSSDQTHPFHSARTCESEGNRGALVGQPSITLHPPSTSPPPRTGQTSKTTRNPATQQNHSLPPLPPTDNGRLLTKQSREINDSIPSNVLARRPTHHSPYQPVPYQPSAINNVLTQREVRASIGASANGGDYQSFNESVHQAREVEENNQSSNWSPSAHYLPPTPPVSHYPSPQQSPPSGSPQPSHLASPHQNQLSSAQIVSPNSSYNVQHLSTSVHSPAYNQYSFDPSTRSLVQRHELRRAEQLSDSFAPLSEEINGQREEEEESGTSSEGESSPEVSHRNKRLRETEEEAPGYSSSSGEEKENQSRKKRSRTEEQPKRGGLGSLVMRYFSLPWKKTKPASPPPSESDSDFEDARED